MALVEVITLPTAEMLTRAVNALWEVHQQYTTLALSVGRDWQTEKLPDEEWCRAFWALDAYRPAIQEAKGQKQLPESPVPNPFASLARLAWDVHRFEEARHNALGTKMQSLPAREKAIEAALLEAAHQARAGWRVSGWPPEKVHERVTALVEGCRRLTAWATLRGDWASLSDAVLVPLRDVQAMSDSCGRQPAAKQAEGIAAPGKRAKRGRKPDPAIDPRQDRRIAEAWDTGRYKDYADLAREKHLTKHDIQLAIDRHRKREARKGR
ncbi:MAG: hypothetical protein JNM56_39810 [Planctomycetia bacterium]|nr:hypothetical protein [Planctomycetia bacterium]